MEREGVTLAGCLTLVNVHIRTVDLNIFVTSVTKLITVILIVEW